MHDYEYNNVCKGVLYTVQPGDTFYSIAKKFKISIKSLAYSNPHISNHSIIFPGQILCIPVNRHCEKQLNSIPYIIKPSDNLYNIASNFRVSVRQILKMNPHITDPNVIYPGQTICIPIQTIKFPCSTILHPVNTENISQQLNGYAFIQEKTKTKYAVTFTAVELPSPQDLGNFDTYIGTIHLSDINLPFSAILTVDQYEDQPRTWTGTRVITDNPFHIDNILSIRAINFETGISGPIVLHNTIFNCK